MQSRLVRIAVLAAFAAVAVLTTGCGQEKEVTSAKTEGVWIDAGPLDYHIQGSRVLEPGLVPDNSYLKGLPAGTTPPAGKDVWFGTERDLERGKVIRLKIL